MRMLEIIRGAIGGIFGVSRNIQMGVKLLTESPDRVCYPGPGGKIAENSHERRIE